MIIDGHNIMIPIEGICLKDSSIYGYREGSNSPVMIATYNDVALATKVYSKLKEYVRYPVKCVDIRDIESEVDKI